MTEESKPESAPGPQSSDPDAIDIRHYLHVVEKRKWLIAAVAACVLAVTLIYTLRQPKIFSATATLLVETSAPQVLGQGVNDVVDLGTGSYWYNKEYFNTQLNIVRSRDVAERTLRMYPAMATAEFWGVGEEIDDAEEKEKVLKNFSAVDMLSRRVQAKDVKDARLITISIEDIDPSRAAAVANGIANAFVEANLDRKVNTTKGAADWLGDQMSELRVKLEDSERTLQKFKEENDILTTGLEDRQKISSERLVMLNTEMTRLKLKKVQQEARLRQANDLKQKSQGAELGGEIARELLDNAVIVELKKRYVELKAQRAEFSERYQEQHPKLVAVTKQMEIVRADLQREIDRTMVAEESAYQETLDVEKRLDEMLAAETKVSETLNRKELGYNKAKREVENSSRLYGLVDRRLKETDLTGGLKANNMSVLDLAQEPKRPIRPSLKRNLAVGLVLGLMLALFAAFGLEYLDNTIKGHEDVEQLLGLPFLGIIPAIAGETKAGKEIRRDLVVLDAPKSSAAECCRSVRTNLMFMSPDRPLRNLVITSAGPQEGKTTVANALAITMAQAGSRVLLVDTDMRRPRMHRVYGVSNEIGVSSVLVGDAKLSDAIKHTEVPNLDILPCGPVPPNPAEMLLSNAFKALIVELNNRYERIVFDSPPVGAVTDPVILGTQTDGVVLVFKGGQTTREIAAQATRSILDANVRILGAIINDLDVESRKYGYYYYSYYKKYGGYYGDYKSDEDKGVVKA